MRKVSIRFFVCLLVATFISSLPGVAQLTDAEKTAVLLDRYRVVANQTYTTQSGVDLKLDVYLPPRPEGRAPGAPRPSVPVVVMIHGGGWIAGTKEGSQLAVLPYLQMGFAAVNVEYRLAKVELAPAAVEDCRCALRWVLDNAKRLGFDTGKIVVTGGSAGGHLALTTGMLPASAGLDRECAVPAAPATGGWSDPGDQGDMKVAAIVNWFGITDVPAMLSGPEERGYAVQWFGSLPNREEIARRVSPLTYVRPGLPPIITIHGDKDTLVPHAQAERLHAALQKAGVPNQLVTIHGAGHGGFTAEEEVTAFSAIKQFLIEQKVIGK